MVLVDWAEGIIPAPQDRIDGALASLPPVPGR